MKILKRLLLLSILFTGKSFAQITFEQNYPSSAMDLYMVDLELSGMKYIKISRNENDRKIQLYNLDHSIWRTIDCNSFPLSYYYSDPDLDGFLDTTASFNYDVLYVSENLFDLDADLEFMFVLNTSGISSSYTGIYNEDGSIVYGESGAYPGCRQNIPQQFRPIYNTPSGTKMILSKDNGDAKVYGLTGTLTLAVANNYSSGEENHLNIYPNPTSGYTTIEYSLPAGVKDAMISIVNANGELVRNYNVDDTFDNLKLGTSELGTGTYFYNLIINNIKTETRKIVVL